MTTTDSLAGTTPADPIDIAIIGGGIGGLYTAWRLATSPTSSSPVLDQIVRREGRPLRVAVFEMAGRIGGRLLTLVPPGMPNVRAELGAMRYRSDHKLVSRLVETELELASEEVCITGADVLYPSGQDGGAEAMLEAIGTIVGDDALAVTTAQWAEIQRRGTWDGVPLAHWGIWNLLHRVAGPRAYAELTGPSGTASVMGNWNAADALPWFVNDLRPDVTTRRPVEGMAEIPRALARRFAAAGGTITCNRELVGLMPERGSVKLTFVSGAERQQVPPVSASHVVLALPRRSLERIADQGRAAVLSDVVVRRLIAAVAPVPTFDLYCCYETPWWRATDRDAGKAARVPGIPFRHILCQGAPADGDSGQASLVMAYGSAQQMEYWVGLLGRDDRLGDPYRGDEWCEYEAPRHVREEAHRLVKLACGVDPAGVAPQPPYAAAVRDWSADPFGGACHAWKIHEKSWEVVDTIVRPVEGLPVYICGEAYSREQGWVQGALESAERLLQKCFSLPPSPG